MVQPVARHGVACPVILLYKDIPVAFVGFLPHFKRSTPAIDEEEVGVGGGNSPIIGYVGRRTRPDRSPTDPWRRGNGNPASYTSGKIPTILRRRFLWASRWRFRRHSGAASYLRPSSSMRGPKSSSLRVMLPLTSGGSAKRAFTGAADRVSAGSAVFFPACCLQAENSSKAAMEKSGMCFIVLY